MRKVPLGASGIEISEFVFGAGSIGGIGASTSTRRFGLSAEEGFERLDEAMDLGINMIDTADSYGGGESEKVVGRWLHDRRPAGVLISTKVGLISRPDGSRGFDLSREHIEGRLARSAERLGRVDLFLSHVPDPDTPIEETLEAFSRAQESGAIGAYGVSNVSGEQLEIILHTADAKGLHRPVTVENRLNLLDREDEARVLPLVMSEGLGYTPFSPLAGGVLSERYLDGAEPQAGSRIAVAGNIYYKGFYTPENLERVTALREIARELTVSVSGLALAWLRDHPAVSAPIVAPRTFEQWDAVKEAQTIRLDEKDHARISAIFS
ncbi:aldo/keto reductase [Spongiactinospora sp. 9N601]|uniref:aldo/keto reductase n=1 Tax=Spongiactinospora sp. 9N601 TaxID=3375149 RepID=UPI003795B883